MSYSSDEFVVLNDGTAAHSLHYSAGRFDKAWIGDVYDHIAAVVGAVVVYLLYLNGEFFGRCAFYSCEYEGFSCLYILTVAHFIFTSAGEERGEAGDERHARAGTVFGNGALGKMDVQIEFFIKILVTVQGRRAKTCCCRSGRPFPVPR